jgi:hypothetical protein
MSLYTNRPVMSIFLFVDFAPDAISLKLCTPKAVGVQFNLYTVYNLYLK